MMTKNEQIDFYCSFTQSKVQDCPIVEEIAKARAEVAKEIFEEIEKQIAFFRMYMFLNSGVKAIVNVLDALKKKYTEVDE